jgi:hypothetical protein
MIIASSLRRECLVDVCGPRYIEMLLDHQWREDNHVTHMSTAQLLTFPYPNISSERSSGLIRRLIAVIKAGQNQYQRFMSAFTSSSQHSFLHNSIRHPPSINVNANAMSSLPEPMFLAFHARAARSQQEPCRTGKHITQHQVSR